MMEWMRRQVAARITSRSKTVGFDRDALLEYPIVFVHGRYDFTWSNEQREVLQQYLKTGGTIIAASICGSEEFSQAFRREIQLVLPKQTLAPLPREHDAFTSRYRGFSLSTVRLNQPNKFESGITVRQKTGPPLVEAMQNDDRYCVLFSPFDISCALENQGGMQCAGYSTIDAAKIGINLILFSLTQ